MKPQGSGQGWEGKLWIHILSDVLKTERERALGGVSSLLWEVFKHRER